MITLKNNGKGPRAVLLRGGNYAFLQPGEQKALDGSKVKAIPADVVEVAIEAQPAGDVPPQPPGLDQQLQQPALGETLTQQPGEGCKPDIPLSEMTRAELEHQLAAEGLDIDHIVGTGRNGAVVMADIRNAIEAKRAGGAA